MESLTKPNPAEDPDVLASRLAPSIRTVSPTRSEPSQAHLKTSLLLLSDGSLASKLKGRREKRGETGRLF